MRIYRKFLINVLVGISLFVPFSIQGMDERKVEDPSTGLASQLGSMSLGERKEMVAEALPLVKIESVPVSLKGINFEVSFKGGKARVRPHKLEDINKTWIERICSYDPTDPMDASNSQAPLPTQEEVCDCISQLLAPECPTAQYGIYDCADGQIMGQFSFLPGTRHFYHAIESTIKIHSDFRGRGLATSVVREMLQATRKLGCVGPLFYIEASINKDNVGSIKSHITAGMIPFPDDQQTGVGWYYYPLKEGLGAPTPIPQLAPGLIQQEQEEGQ